LNPSLRSIAKHLCADADIYQSKSYARLALGVRKGATRVGLTNVRFWPKADIQSHGTAGNVN